MAAERAGTAAAVASRLKTIFAPSEAGKRAGVWVGGAVTRTRASPTLFISGVPRGVEPSAVEQLFAAEPGFVSMRAVRRMCFVDFTDERCALAAMRRHQGAVLPGATGPHPGLLIDFDKDKRAKRDRQFERQREKEEHDRRLALLDCYWCLFCKAPVLYLTRDRPLASMPRRGTDGSHVVEEGVYLKELNVVRGEVRSIKREGKGIERQFPLHCTMCDLPVAYRPVPLEQATKYLYVLPDALTADKTAPVPLSALSAEAAAVAAATAEARRRQQEAEEAAAAAAEAAEGDGEDEDEADDPGGVPGGELDDGGSGSGSSAGVGGPARSAAALADAAPALHGDDASASSSSSTSCSSSGIASSSSGSGSSASAPHAGAAVGGAGASSDTAPPAGRPGSHGSADFGTISETASSSSFSTSSASNVVAGGAGDSGKSVSGLKRPRPAAGAGDDEDDGCAVHIAHQLQPREQSGAGHEGEPAAKRSAVEVGRAAP